MKVCVVSHFAELDRTIWKTKQHFARLIRLKFGIQTKLSHHPMSAHSSNDPWTHIHCLFSVFGYVQMDGHSDQSHRWCPSVVFRFMTRLSCPGSSAHPCFQQDGPAPTPSHLRKLSEKVDQRHTTGHVRRVNAKTPYSGGPKP